jgi:fatty acid desaturase
VYSCWLSAFYGCPLFAWIPTHTQNHHRYTNGDGDETRTSRHTEHDTVWAALTYPLKCARWQLPSVVRHFHKQRARGRARALYAQLLVLAAAQLAALVLGVRQHGTTLGLVLYGTVVLGPALLAPYLMMLTNYFQHVGCDANSPHDHSRNFVSSFWNWCVFDNGYHTAHHDRPGLHWSRLRDAHARRSHLISPHLNQSTPVAYCAASYGPVGNARRRSTRTQAKAASMSS